MNFKRDAWTSVKSWIVGISKRLFSMRIRRICKCRRNRMIEEIVVEIDWRIDRAREICRKANRKKKTCRSFAARVRNHVKLKTIERKINGVPIFISSSRMSRSPLSNAAAHARSIFSVENATIRRTGAGYPDSFFIVRSFPALFYRSGMR